MKKKLDLSAMRKKIAHPGSRDKFVRADEILGTNEVSPQHEKIIRKSYSLLKRDIDTIKTLSSRLMKNEVDVSVSHLVRLGLSLAAKLDTEELIKATYSIPMVHTGRPRKT